MIFKNWLTYFSLLAILLLALPQSGWGQRKDVAQALRNLERNIENARELAQSFNNKRAIDLINTAQKLLNEARALAEKDKFGAAVAKVKAANAILEQAVKLTLEGPVRRLRSKLDNLLQRANTDLSGNLNKDVNRILQEARRNRDAAEKALSAGKLRKAVEHYRVAITLVERALAIIKNPKTNSLDAIDQDKRRYEDLLERAREEVEHSDNQQARQIFTQALKLSDQAQRAYRKGDMNSAKKYYNQSVLLLLRAMDLSTGNSKVSVNQAETALSRLRDLIDRTRSDIVGAGRPRARVIYERAKRFAGEAEISIQQGHGFEARWKIELATNMIRRAKRIAGNGGSRQFANKLADEIDKTRREIADYKSRVTPDTPNDAELLLEMSQFTIKKAERANKAGLHRLALEAVLTSQKFLTRADKILSSPGTSTASVSEKTIQVRLQQLNSAIQDAENRLTGTGEDWNRQLLKNADDIRKFSEKSFQKRNYQAAEEGIQVAFDLVRKSLKNVPK